MSTASWSGRPSRWAWSSGDASVNPTGIHRSLLAGLLSQIGIKDTTTRQEAEGQAGRLHRRPADPVQDLPRLGPGQEATGGGDERRAGGDQPPVRPDERGHRPGLGRADRRRSGQAQLRRAALGEEAGCGRRLRAGDALRRSDRRPAEGAVRPDRPRVCPGAVHPHMRWSRANGISTGSDPGEGLRPGQPQAAHRAGPGGGAHPAPRHPLDDEAVFDFYDRRIPAEV